jgi:putative flippase GtrA
MIFRIIKIEIKDTDLLTASFVVSPDAWSYISFTVSFSFNALKNDKITFKIKK